MGETINSARETAWRPHVYVSFSGFDAEFAQSLIRELKYDGRFEVSCDPDFTIDENGWKDQVSDLVAWSDTVVMVLSPDAVETCGWELECALEHSKRIIPVVCRHLEDANLPDPLCHLKPLDCQSDRSYATGVAELVRLLGMDVDWLHEHSRLLARARQWDKSGRPNHLLLSKAEIHAAKMWTFNRPNTAGKPNDLHMTFISTSEAVNHARHGAVRSYFADLEEREAIDYLRSAPEGRAIWWKQAAVMCVLLIVALAALSGRQTSNAEIGLSNQPSGTHDAFTELAVSDTDRLSRQNRLESPGNKSHDANRDSSDLLGLKALTNSVLWRLDAMRGRWSDADHTDNHRTVFTDPPEK